MKKYFYLLLLAMVPMCFAACSSDDEEGGSSGLSASNLVGEWVVIANHDNVDWHENESVGKIWGFNADGTFYGDNSDIYVAWKIVGGKLQMTRTDGRKEDYKAEIKDGKLYLEYDREYKVLEKVSSN